MKALLVVPLILLLAVSGCQNEPKVVFKEGKVIVIDPPKNLFNCPQLGKIPNPETLTNKQVAEFIEKLYKYHKTCGINMNKIQKYIEQAKKIYGVT